MRGTPFLHFVTLAAFFALLAIPLARLTGARPPVRAAALPIDDAAHHLVVPGKPAFLTVRYAHTPDRLMISIAGKPILEETRFDESPLEADIVLPAFKNQMELAVQASWPAGTPETALTIVVEPEGRFGRSVTLWSLDSEIDTVSSFDWSRP